MPTLLLALCCAVVVATAVESGVEEDAATLLTTEHKELAVEAVKMLDAAFAHTAQVESLEKLAASNGHSAKGHATPSAGVAPSTDGGKGSLGESAESDALAERIMESFGESQIAKFAADVRALATTLIPRAARR